MAVVRANLNDTRLLARLIRAEAESDGKLGMLLVGNVGVNRIRANCLDFKGIRSMSQMVYQSPGGFEATQKGYFYQRARSRDVRLARQVIQGSRFVPANYSLWFFNPFGRSCPPKWFNQFNSGKYKSHCFFAPTGNNCPGVYQTY